MAAAVDKRQSSLLVTEPTFAHLARSSFLVSQQIYVRDYEMSSALFETDGV
jgi:hypothetical protein